MSKKVVFYTISMHKNNSIIDYPVPAFFEDISDKMLTNPTDNKILRKIGDKYIRLFTYHHSLTNKHKFVVPFGKLKNTNKPYRLNNDILEEIPETLYDINSLGLDFERKVALFTTNREGPSIQTVEAYLNTYIPQTTGLTLRIKPIMHSKGLEEIRNADLVSSIIFTLNLDKSLNTFYTEEIDANKDKALINAFKSIAKSAKDDGNSKALSLKLSLGQHSSRKDTLDLDNMLYLLNLINIDADFVKEIKVHYKGKKNEKIETAKLKESNLPLSCTISGKDTQVSPSNLLNNMVTAISDKNPDINRHVNAYFSNTEQYGNAEFNIVEKWNTND